MKGATAARHALLISGRPRSGKTTLMRRLVDFLADRRLRGFYTEEILEGGRRKGFRIRTLDGREGLLAHVDHTSSYRVGKYPVDVEGFEEVALPALEREPGVDFYVLDEIGKMECFSERFVAAVRDLLESGRPLVATVALRGGGFIAEARAREDVELLELTPRNRDRIFVETVSWIEAARPLR